VVTKSVRRKRSPSLRYLGLTDIKELPDYEKLSSHQALEDLLNQDNEQKKSAK